MISSVKFEERLTDWDVADERRRRATAGSYIPCMEVDQLCWCHSTSAQLLTQLIMMYYSISRLNHSFGVAGVAHLWIKTYLSDRSHFVRIGSHTSQPVTCNIGVPQGSVLGPLLFSVYTFPISKISRIRNVQQQQYADDTQLCRRHAVWT